MKKIIAGMLASFIILSPALGATDKDTYVENDSKSAFDLTTVKDTDLKNLIIEHEAELQKVEVFGDYEYNANNFFKKKVQTSEFDIPKEISERLKKTRLVMTINPAIVYPMYADGAGNFKEMAVEEIQVDPVDSEDAEIIKRMLSINYAPNKKISYKTMDLLTNEELKKLNDSNRLNGQIKLQLIFDNDDTVIISNGNINIPSKMTVLQSVYNKINPDKDLYYYMDESVIRDYLQDKYSDLERKEYTKTLENIRSNITKKIDEVEDQKDTMLDSIKKEEDFETKLGVFRDYRSLRELLDRINQAAKTELRNIEAFNIIDSL